MVNVKFDKFFFAVEAQSVLVFKYFLNIISVVKSFCVCKSSLSVSDVCPSLFFVVLAIPFVLIDYLFRVLSFPFHHAAYGFVTMFSGVVSHLSASFLTIFFVTLFSLLSSTNLASWMKSRGLRVVGVKELSGSREKLFTGSALFHGSSITKSAICASSDCLGLRHKQRSLLTNYNRPRPTHYNMLSMLGE